MVEDLLLMESYARNQTGHLLGGRWFLKGRNDWVGGDEWFWASTSNFSPGQVHFRAYMQAALKFIIRLMSRSTPGWHLNNASKKFSNLLGESCIE
ncbi:hypothetical protein H7A76_27410 [Pseudomonas sp. MSSRFD41]|uniref:hypothetical protein n=1 Tax=Pseudomonas sp. MSSRFD41 TaxID=1310370 RepID=UPI00163AD4C8|nr:hypothetical protein [Pseudomonas sp. MSSRFD41]MBC2659185.1 hypothetical protein [Pseudomonas sp. MSSRFD41]